MVQVLSPLQQASHEHSGSPTNGGLLRALSWESRTDSDAGMIHDLAMLALQLVPTILSLLVLAAHFWRHANLPFVVISFVVIGLLSIRRAWAARIVQIALTLGAIEWIRSAVDLAGVRAEFGLPYGRLLVILGGVAAFSICSAFTFRARRARRWYRLDRPSHGQ